MVPEQRTAEQTITAHDARAWLVYYIASCHRYSIAFSAAGHTAAGAVLHQVAEDLSTMLRAWDVHVDCRPP